MPTIPSAGVDVTMPFCCDVLRMKGVYTSRLRVLLLECVVNGCSFDFVVTVVEAFTFFFDGSGSSCKKQKLTIKLRRKTT